MAPMSDFAWVALDQLKKGDVWDGDLVSKSGRSELITLGLAERKGQGMNGLTFSGRELAARTAGNWSTGKRQ
jgi:hypothetical protein